MWVLHWPHYAIKQRWSNQIWQDIGQKKREMIRNPFWNVGLYPFLLGMNVTLGTLVLVIMGALACNSHAHVGRAALLTADAQGPWLIELPPAGASWGHSHHQWNVLVWKRYMFLLFTIHWPNPTIGAQTQGDPEGPPGQQGQWLPPLFSILSSPVVCLPPIWGHDHGKIQTALDPLC